jgi:DNA-directed RNA polymerase specialized sigma24 family protein
MARSRHYQKREGEAQKVSLDEALEVSRKVQTLAAIDPRKSQVVELRFFGGLSADETAEVLKVSPDTVLRDWKLSKVWLLREMKKAGKGDK